MYKISKGTKTNKDVENHRLRVSTLRQCHIRLSTKFRIEFIFKNVLFFFYFQDFPLPRLVLFIIYPRSYLFIYSLTRTILECVKLYLVFFLRTNVCPFDISLWKRIRRKLIHVPADCWCCRCPPSKCIPHRNSVNRY